MTKPSTQVSAPTHTREGAQALSDTKLTSHTGRQAEPGTTTTSDETSRTSTTEQDHNARHNHQQTSSSQQHAENQQDSARKAPRNPQYDPSRESTGSRARKHTLVCLPNRPGGRLAAPVSGENQEGGRR